MSFYLSLCIFKIALPVLLLICTIFRPCALSGIYLLFFFILPFVPVPTRHNIHKIPGIYLKILLAVCVLTALSQIIFQIVLFSLPPYGQFLKNCDFLEQLFRHIGFVKLNGINPISAITWLSPEIIMLAGSIVVYISCKKLSTENEISENGIVVHKVKSKRQLTRIALAVGKYLLLVSLCITAILRPSIPGGVYFLLFLSATTWWACCKKLERKFGYLLRIFLIFIAAHIITLYLYQMQWPPSFLDKAARYARYFGLSQLMTVSCTDPRNFIWSSSLEWDSFLNPLMLLWLYYITATESSLLLRTELINSTSPPNKYGSNSKKPVTIMQDSTGSVVVAAATFDEIPLQQLDDDQSEEEKPTIFDNIIIGIETFISVAIKSSYIFTNIIMMTWSITFHSWLTFVLLLMANILWMVPNQRRAMLRFSPFLVCYAWFLLISAYIFSMDLTADELPQVIGDIDLGLIGFKKVQELPCQNLFIQCLFTTMFWITLKQYMTERIELKQLSLTSMGAPLQVTVGTAGLPKEHDSANETLEKIGKYVKPFFTKTWVWIVALTLFGIAITGNKMTLFRIIYMALFLLFLLSFQLSYMLWRKTLLAFWIAVILYSMVMLILVYTYQFEDIRGYWATYLHVTPQEQLDIGLEYYAPKQLFIRLATPTFCVIITAIQIHYFHKEYLRLSMPGFVDVTEEAAVTFSESDHHEPVSDKSDLDTSNKFNITEIGSISTVEVKEKLYQFMRDIKHFMNLSLIFFELHFPVIAMLVCILMCIFDKCALYFPVTILVVIALLMGRRIVLVVIYICSVIVSILLLLRMLYQIDYIDHTQWNVNCEFLNETLNNAQWLGFSKTTAEVSLYSLVVWNIAYIAAVTLMSILNIRKEHIRIERYKYGALFPEINRHKADRNLSTAVKYLINFGYYKFGVEISLIFMVFVISYRLDFYAVVYSVWLFIFILLARETLKKVWNVFYVLLAIFIPLQYFMLIGLPPELCNKFVLPWENNLFLQHLQQWFYLFSFNNILKKENVLCDFILYLLIARQAIVFKLEKREHPGGSNESVIHNIEDPEFVIPVPDFVTFCRSYLDVAKRGILLSWIWISLAIMFLAGTQRVTIYSVGYLLGCFTFLWQGSDIYLRPIPAILKTWNLLLSYNVIIIILKTASQILGCCFFSTLLKNACWLVHLFAIGCRDGTGVLPNKNEPDECKINEYMSLTWDCFCFAFLILQRRIFHSYYFFHIINETKATTILASRGAELIEELRSKRICDKEEGEKKVLEKIKLKMERIKAGQQKITGQTYHDTDNHFVDGIFPGSRPRHRLYIPNSHSKAIRSGDYYMFDEIEDEQLDLIEETPQSSIDEEDEQEDEKMRLGQTPTLGAMPSRVVVIDPKEQAEEPKPGTSKEEDFSDLTEPDKDGGTFQSIINYVMFVWLFIQSCCLSIALYLNKYSKDYRYVLRVLNREKKLLKERTNYYVGLRLGTSQIWQPAGSYQTLAKDAFKSEPTKDIMDDYEYGEMSAVDQPPVIKMLLSMWYIILSHSHILCYFMIFLKQIKSGTFLSLPLPLFVLFWGSLSIPRPTKTFWVTLIAYTEIIVLIKCLFQFDIIPWNRNQNISPLFPPRIIGIEKRSNYALWDLLLLLMLFFHRFLLKCLGLWRSTYVPAVLASGEYKVSNETLQALEEDPSSLSRRKSLSGELDESMATNTTSDETSPKETACIKITELHPCVNLGRTIVLRFSKYGSSIKQFFQGLLDPSSRIATDVYSYMFLCDFFNFFVILIGYSSFGPYTGDEGVSDYLQENKVPVLFLLMLIVQFVLIIIDRAIFLRKNIFAKMIFQFLQVIFLHIWLFIIYPLITDRAFNSVVAPQMYYMVKSFYLLLSAYQIRSGYPTRILGNFLCRGYNYFNLFLYKGFLAIPFLFELRTVMDWMWTDTSMTVFDWMKMEDVFSHIFQVKCNRYCESEYPQPRGEKKPSISKYLVGGAALIAMIAIIWFPLVFFSLIDAVGHPNPPFGASLELRISTYEPIYQMSVQSNSIFRLNDIDFDRFNKRYEEDKDALTFLANYQAADVVAIKFSNNSASVWSISPPDRERLIAELNSTYPVDIMLRYLVSHKSNTKEDTGTIQESVTITLKNEDSVINPVRQNILDMLLTNETTTPAVLEYIIPKFIKVTNKGTAKPVSQLMEEYTNPADTTFRNLSITRQTRQDSEWWSIAELCNDQNYVEYLSQLPYVDCSSIVIYGFNEKLFPSTLNFITGAGIIGVYTTMVLVAGRLLRSLFSGVAFKIMFEDLPNVDRILQLCFDIYLVRESREFVLEEDLFAKLIFLFRSPETLIKWTRPKEEDNDDDDENDDSSHK